MLIDDASCTSAVVGDEDRYGDDNHGEPGRFETHRETGNDVGGVAHLRGACDALDWAVGVVCVVLGDSDEQVGDSHSHC